ncbi:MAG: methylenetetrahydrofolate reductase [Desulfurococcales archaeon]|nr:methylenetetrahydrofolate reductase [Desulfurococcales archaeon]
MELIAELGSVRSRGELLEKASMLLGVFDYIDVPDSPLGKPSIHSLTAALILSEALNANVIAHVRVVDYNKLALDSMMKTVRLSRIKRLVLLRGDPPVGSTVVGDYSVEGAMARARKLIPGVEVGLLLSLRKSFEEIMERVRLSPDFMLVLNLSIDRVGLLEAVAGEARRRGIRLYPYIILETERNRDILARVSQPKIRGLRELEELVSSIEGLVEGVLLSCPQDYGRLVEAASRVERG